MNDVIAQLKREPKGTLRPFFSARVSAMARERTSARARKMVLAYMTVAMIAVVCIVWTSPGSKKIAPVLTSVGAVTVLFYRRALHRAAAKFFG